MVLIRKGLVEIEADNVDTEGVGVCGIAGTDFEAVDGFGFGFLGDLEGKFTAVATEIEDGSGWWSDVVQEDLFVFLVGGGTALID